VRRPHQIALLIGALYVLCSLQSTLYLDEVATFVSQKCRMLKLQTCYALLAPLQVRMLNHCIREPHSHLAVYVMQQDSTARLDFIQVSINLLCAVKVLV
jgi:hypothetical protein